MPQELPTEEVIGLAKAFIQIIASIDPKHEKAFYRFQFEPMRYGSNSSYVVGANVFLVDPFQHGRSLEHLNAISAALFQYLDNRPGVLLLTTDADFNYDIRFEYDDLERWKINKLNGSSGIPQGL